MEYIGSNINESATVVYPAGADISGARGIALALGEGGVVTLPEAGANVIGISVIETGADVSEGFDIDIQIKDIGKWVAGADIKAGDELTTDAAGKAVVAGSGDFITGIALDDTPAGAWIPVQITKSGYKA